MITGKISVIEETKEYGQKGFRKRLVVIEQDQGKFTNHVPLEFTRDMCHLPDAFQVGETLQVEFKPNGRKYQRDSTSPVQYFVSLEVTQILSDHADIENPF
jgi:hypothetical protein